MDEAEFNVVEQSYLDALLARDEANRRVQMIGNRWMRAQCHGWLRDAPSPIVGHITRLYCNRVAGHRGDCEHRTVKP